MKGVIPLIPSRVAEARTATATEARLQELLAQYGAFLRRTIVRMCPRAMGLSYDDIEQEARVRLWTALKNETEITYPGSYIYRVAVSATLRAIRRVQARREEQLHQRDDDRDGGPGEELQATEASPEEVAARRESVRKVETALGRLAENRRIAVGLHLQGLTVPEIARLLQWSEAKVRNLVHRGMKDLRRELRAEGIEYTP